MPSDTCVIFNPSSGRGRGAARLAKLQHQLADHVVFWPTEKPGHAEELATKAAQLGFRIVAAAGGDGTVHEVANGLLAASRPEVAFAVIPIGSANDYAHSLEYGRDKSSTIAERTVDVGLVRNATGRQRYFVCCLGLGFSGMVTLESRRIKWLQGLPLYGLATLRALWNHHACPPLDIAIDDQPSKTCPTLMLSALVGRREGGFVLGPDAKLDDGLFDYVHVGDLSRWGVIKLLPRLAIAGPPQNHPKVRLGQCRRLVIRSPSPLVVHLDGEFFAKPEDNVRELVVGLIPHALKVQVRIP